jgi:hypothetical protein
MNFGYFSTFQTLDKGLIEKLGPTGFTFSLFNLSSNLITSNSGYIYHTIFAIIVFALAYFS